MRRDGARASKWRREFCTDLQWREFCTRDFMRLVAREEVSHTQVLMVLSALIHFSPFLVATAKYCLS